MGGNVVGHDLRSLFSSNSRDYLLNNNGQKIDIEMLKGKNLGLYFSAAWCGPCQRFTPSLVETYNELSSKSDFEIIFVSADDDEKSFNEYFSKMPWLALPFSDLEGRDRLDDLFKVRGIPHLIILDKDGKMCTDSGVDLVREYGAEAYPFTHDKITQLVRQEESAKMNQSLRSIMVSPSHDFVISSKEEKVPVAELEGKVVGLYFSISSYNRCIEFEPKLVDVYEKLKEKGKRFEVVLISLDQDEELFKEGLRSIPWLALPFRDLRCDKLVRRFEISTLPTLVIIGEDGKTLQSNVVIAIEEHGFLTYPFTIERFAELAKVEKEKEEAQTLESVLVLGDHDFVIKEDGTKVQVEGIPVLITIGADGRTVTKDAVQLVSCYGAKAYPFNADRMEELKLEIETMAKNWPKKVNHTLHENHELVLKLKQVYGCDGCEKEGRLWSYACEECNFDLHPKCALEKRSEYSDGMEEWSNYGG